MGEFIFALIVACFFLAGVWVGAGTIESRDNLVKSNHAEYYLDENHERQFRLKECK